MYDDTEGDLLESGEEQQWGQYMDPYTMQHSMPANAMYYGPHGAQYNRMDYNSMMAAANYYAADPKQRIASSAVSNPLQGAKEDIVMSSPKSSSVNVHLNSSTVTASVSQPSFHQSSLNRTEKYSSGNGFNGSSCEASSRTVITSQSAHDHSLHTPVKSNPSSANGLDGNQNNVYQSGSEQPRPLNPTTECNEKKNGNELETEGSSAKSQYFIQKLSQSRKELKNIRYVRLMVSICSRFPWLWLQGTY